MKTIFVGNLATEATEDDVRALFSEYGTVRKLDMPRDIFTGRNRGFALVSMEGHEVRAATTALNGKMFMNNCLKIRDEKAKPGKRGGRR